MTSSNGNISTWLAPCLGSPLVTGEFPSQRLVTQSFVVFFDLLLNKRLSKRWRRRWFERPSCSLWRHCNGNHTIVPASKAVPDEYGWLCQLHLKEMIIVSQGKQSGTNCTLFYLIYYVWRHQGETISASLALCAGNPPVTGGIPLKKASEVELWGFLWSGPEQTVEQTMETSVIWDVIALIVTSLQRQAHNCPSTIKQPRRIYVNISIASKGNEHSTSRKSQQNKLFNILHDIP